MEKPTLYWLSVRLGAFALALWAALSMARIPGDWGHSICGTWGCGPPLQAILACHTAWMVVLFPLTALVIGTRRLSPRFKRRLGLFLCFAAVLTLFSVILYQRMTWWPVVSELSRDDFWQRIGFVVATMVDVPVFQIMIVGILLATVGTPRFRPQALNE